MKRILITGVNSYLGNAIEQYLAEYNAALGKEAYHVDTLSLREEAGKEDAWKQTSFAGYDTILHVAGIAHADVGNVSQDIQDLYYRINCGMTLEVAQKARKEGVPQFVYFSSVIVYGDSGSLGKPKVITADTKPQPANFYGDSKWQAEQGLQSLAADGQNNNEEQIQQDFNVAILRLPMIYGKGSKGNFPLLVKLAAKMPVFPAVNNQRSMLYVENLAEFVRLLVEHGGGGIFFPQNAEYVTTAHMVQAIGKAQGRKIRLWKILNPFVVLASYVPGKIGKLVNKAFGSLTIDRELTDENIKLLGDFYRYDLKTGIAKSVEKIS